MKMKHSFWSVLFLGLVVLVINSSCSSEPEAKVNPTGESTDSPFPESLTVKIPASLSAVNELKSETKASAEGDTDGGFNGHEMYQNLRVFIAIAEHGANFVEEVMDAIRIYDLARALDTEYTADEDGRVKHLVVKENQMFEGVEYKFGLTITDADSESDTDGGVGLQLFWSGNPVKGVAIVKPENFDNTSNDLGSGLIRIDYTQADPNYDATMVVSLSGLPLEDPNEKFDVDNIKLFVGKKGDTVDVYGNSNHPQAYFTSVKPAVVVGMNYAFVASANDAQDFATAEVALPPSTLNSLSRLEILKDYSIRNVLISVIADEYKMTIDSVTAYVDKHNLIVNANPPGFFANGAFVSSETAPDPKYDALVKRMDALTPYNPTYISSLKIELAQ